MKTKEKIGKFFLSKSLAISSFLFRNRKTISTIFKILPFVLIFVFASATVIFLSLAILKRGAFPTIAMPKQVWWIINSVLGVFLVIISLYLVSLVRKNRKEKPKGSEPAKAPKPEENTATTEKKSDKGLSKAVWIILVVFVGLPVLGVLIIVGVWLYGTSYQKQEKVWVATLAVMPGHKEQYDVRNFSRRTCEIVDTPASFQMACSNEHGKDIYKWDDKSSPEGKWWRENRENNVGGTFRIQKVSPTLYLGVEKTRSGKESSFQVSLQNK